MIIFILFMLLSNSLFSQSKFGDTIPIFYSSNGGYGIKDGYIRIGWHKVVNKNKTVHVVGNSYTELFNVKGFKRLKFKYLDESVENQSNFIYNNTDIDKFQYIIKDGDTINYYDFKGKRQGLFYSNVYYSKGNQQDEKRQNYLSMCNNCKAIYTTSRYINDLISEDLIYGINDKNIIDTIVYNIYKKDTIFRREKINLEHYIKYANKILAPNNSPRISDTIKTYYNSGELFSVALSGGYGIIIGQSYVYWKNGKLKFLWNFNNGYKDGLNYEYYESGKLKYIFTYEKGKLIKTEEKK
jgi:hypothetical protein